jgi:hypothetical protein
VARSPTHHHTDAEDLVPDTLVRAYRPIDRFDGQYPRAWLPTILLRNTKINRQLAVALSGIGQRGPVNNGHGGVSDVDDALTLEGPQDSAHARPLHSEELRDQLLAELETPGPGRFPHHEGGDLGAEITPEETVEALLARGESGGESEYPALGESGFRLDSLAEPGGHDDGRRDVGDGDRIERGRCSKQDGDVPDHVTRAGDEQDRRVLSFPSNEGDPTDTDEVEGVEVRAAAKDVLPDPKRPVGKAVRPVRLGWVPTWPKDVPCVQQDGGDLGLLAGSCHNLRADFGPGWTPRGIRGFRTLKVA